MKTGSSYLISPFLRPIPMDNSGTQSLLERRLFHYEEGSLRQQNNNVILLDYFHSRIIILSQYAFKMLAIWEAQDDPYRGLSKQNRRLFDQLTGSGLLILPSQLKMIHRYRTLEIEINRNCNFRCVYCPVRFDPKPKDSMSMSLYKQVLSRCVEYGIEQISLHHYSEPTLDPLLVQRLALAINANLSVELYTNGSNLNQDKLNAMAKMGGVKLIVNFPEADRDHYRMITGSDCYDKVLRNLQLAGRLHIPVTLVVNSGLGKKSDRINRIKDACANITDDIVDWDTDNRAGKLDIPIFCGTPQHQGLLNGCLLAIMDLNVSWKGDVFLCAQDYDQRYIFGNLRDESLCEIIQSSHGWGLRKYVFGIEHPPENFICRRCSWTRSFRYKPDAFRRGNHAKLPVDEKLLAECFEKKWEIRKIDVERSYGEF